MLDLKQGQIVTLKSGGPLMAVDYTYYSYRAMVVCVWHDETGFHKKAFSEHLLEIVELEEEAPKKEEDID